jgi:hypothetical protein
LLVHASYMPSWIKDFRLLAPHYVHLTPISFPTSFAGNLSKFLSFSPIVISFRIVIWLLPRRSVWLPWHDEWTTLSSREGFYCLL